MNAHLAQAQAQVQETLPQLKRSYYRLALICGKPGSGKTTILRALHENAGYPLCNVNLEISERLLEHSVAERRFLIPHLVRELVQRRDTEVILLDNLELLFDVSLDLHPLQILQSCSRNTTIAASWSGHYSDGLLSYAEPGHPEYRTYRLSPEDARIFNLE